MLRLRAALGYRHVDEQHGRSRNMTHTRYSLMRPGLPNNDPNRPGAVRRPDNMIERKMEASRMKHKWRRDAQDRAGQDKVIGVGKEIGVSRG